jgi:hypothetical protein
MGLGSLVFHRIGACRCRWLGECPVSCRELLFSSLGASVVGCVVAMEPGRRGGVATCANAIHRCLRTALTPSAHRILIPPSLDRSGAMQYFLYLLYLPHEKNVIYSNLWDAVMTGIDHSKHSRM